MRKVKCFAIIPCWSFLQKRLSKCPFTLLARLVFMWRGRKWKIIKHQVRKFHVVVRQTMTKTFTRKRATRAAQLFFLTQPIILLICDVVVALRCRRRFLTSLTSRKWHQRACRTCSAIIFPHSTNQILQSCLIGRMRKGRCVSRAACSLE